MKIQKCVLLDWDGTVVNTLPIWLEVYSQVFKEYGKTVSVKDIFGKAYGNPEGSAAFGIYDCTDFNNRLFELVKEEYYKAPLHKNVASTLKVLKEAGNCSLSIVTSTRRDMVERALCYHRITKLIDLVVGREDIEELKPSPKALQFALDRLLCGKENSLLVGDSDRDILAAKNAGIHSVLFLPKENLGFVDSAELVLLKPTYIINLFEEVAGLVNNLTR